MAPTEKGQSPFTPGQPVAFDLFVGRRDEIHRLLERGASQVRGGKPMSFFVQGEYGIGKSSIARAVQRLAETDYNLHAIYVQLGGATTLADMAARILEGTLRSGALDPGRGETLRNWLARYVGKQDLFGLSLNLEALRSDAPSFSTPAGLLGFLREVFERLGAGEGGVRGLFLVLDEINGITANPDFAHFLKGIIDENAMAPSPLPLLLMLCGVEDRRREMIRQHQPVDRIFDVVEISPMTRPESLEFFEKAFERAGIVVDADATELMSFLSAGLPKIMHEVGEQAFWLDQDRHITKTEATNAVMAAAEEVGKKYVDQQVIAALRSPDYHAILERVSANGLTYRFSRSEVAKDLTAAQRGKLDNFLQRMKALGVLRAGDSTGEWVFAIRMVGVYLWLRQSGLFKHDPKAGRGSPTND